MEVYKYKRKIMQLTQHFLKPTIHVTADYSPNAKAEASKVSERPVPVLKVTFSGDASGTYTSTTLSQSISSFVFTPVILLSLPLSANAVTSAAYDTVCLIFLKVCSTFFFPCTSHMNPVWRLKPNSWMSSRGRKPLGRPSSSSSSISFFLQMASPPVTTSAPARWLSMAWDAMVGHLIYLSCLCRTVCARVSGIVADAALGGRWNVCVMGEGAVTHLYIGMQLVQRSNAGRAVLFDYVGRARQIWQSQNCHP